MKSIIYIFTFILSIYSVQAQELSGYWLGAIDIQGQKLRIAFNISKEGDVYKTTMDSPDQKAKGIPTQTKSMTSEHIEVQIPNMAVVFTGKLSSASVIDGTFTQGNMNFPLILNKETPPNLGQTRPQTPKKPYPYSSEDIYFENSKAGIKLAGTLTKPNTTGRFPAIILISGSGPQNRDEELMDHKPFLVLADYFTKLGYAVLRYDDRGTYGSEGDFKTSTSLDFADDTEAAVNYLKTRSDIDNSKIGLMGHSEGGLIAPLVASRNKDVAFIVLLAGPGVSGEIIIADQSAEISRINGENEDNITSSTEITKLTFDYLETIKDRDDRHTLLSKYLTKLIDERSDFSTPAGMPKEQFIQAQVGQLCSPWMTFFLYYNPQDALKKVSCPVLAINGSKDLQVKSSLNLPAIEKALKSSPSKTYKTIESPELNHLFQECKTGSPNEYQTITQTFSPIALKTISDWMNELN